jgi:tetratricopeptide (TPR) repeat protein
MTAAARLRQAAAVVVVLVGASAAQAVPPALAAFSAAVDAQWDYAQPALSQQRFGAELAQWPASDAQALVVATQIARAQALSRDFAGAQATLDAVETQLPGMPAHVRVRYLLERGRTFNSAGAPERAVPLFREAYDLAACDGDEFYAIDAAHMLGIATPLAERLDWDRRALALTDAATTPRARRWRASLYNNIGETYLEQGEYAAALAKFRQALPAWEARGDPAMVRSAQWMIARAERSLGLLDDAERIQRQLLAANAALGETDGYVYEELAEIALARRDAAGARGWAARAHAALRDDPDLQAHEPARLARLEAIAQGRPAPAAPR